MPNTTDVPGFWKRIAFDNQAALYEHAAGQGSATSVFFIIFPATPPKNAPATLSLKDSWELYPGGSGSNGGCYIFFADKAGPDFLGVAKNQVAALNQKIGPGRRYFIWMPEAASPDSAQYVAFNTSGQPGKVIGKLTVPSQIQLLNLRFAIGAGAQITADFTKTWFLFNRAPGADIQLISFKRDNLKIGTVETPVLLTLDAPSAGAFAYNITMSVTGEQGESDFKNLGVGLKYFFERDNRIVSQFYPVFGPPVITGPLRFNAGLDPLHPLSHDVSFFAFSAPGAVQPPVMRTSLRTRFGHHVTLAPVRGVSKLVLQSDVETLRGPTNPQTELYYAAPAGPFLLNLVESPAGQDPPQLMCGLSGVETVGFNVPQTTGYKGDLLTFHPDRPAFAANFPLSPNGGGSGQDSTKLDDRYTTSWITVAAVDSGSGNGPVYNSQGEGSWLYAVGKGAGKIDTSFLGHYLAPAASLTSSQADDSFPLVPYSRVSIEAGAVDVFSQDEIRNFEFQIIGFERRNLILGRAQRGGTTPSRATPSTTGTTLATTPQGFLIEVAQDGAWQRLQLAKTEWRPAPEQPPQTFLLQFHDLNRKLQAAFQTNQQFLVVTEPNPCWKLMVQPAGTALCDQQTAFDNFIRLGDWPFQFDTGIGNVFGDYRNVLIFKFCDGKLTDLVKNPQQWTSAADFNPTADGELGAVSSWIQDYVAEAQRNVENGAEQEYFQKFIDTVTSPTWQGVLALKVDVNLSNFPRELQGLLAGIDLNRFFAHHIGIELSFVKDENGQLAADGSTSLFGLIYYLDPSFQSQIEAGGSADLPVAVPPGVDYYFKVLTLKVLFSNSEVKKFSSKTQITLNKLFGEQTSKVTTIQGASISNSIVLDGSYENHDGRSVYVFNTDADNKFWLGSNLWNYVEVTRAQFSTLENQETAANDVRGRFTFSGFLNFGEIPGFDALSFGSEQGQAETDAQKGLSFANLYLEQQFNLETPSLINYTFNSDEMTFSIGQSTSRKASLYSRFPINLTSMVRGTSEKPPDRQGYLPVSASQIRRGSLGDTWYGLVFDLNMGTPGALAQSVGFNSELLIAWSPGSLGSNYRLVMGMRLPGTGSGESKLFSLQGVLKLTIDQIQFYRTVNDESGSSYILRLTNILLSLLGIKFPPGTSTIFFLFGDPRPGAARDSLGWYAAINRESKPNPPQAL